MASATAVEMATTAGMAAATTMGRAASETSTATWWSTGAISPWCWPRGAGGLFAQVEPYLPPRIFALFGLPVASLMFESWNIVPYQVWFFLGLLICLDIVRQLKSFELRLAAIALAAVYVLSKLVFIIRGVDMVDGYELSEVRELYISLLFLAHGWMLAKRFRQHR